jgi:hypothetical protein
MDSVDLGLPEDAGKLGDQGNESASLEEEWARLLEDDDEPKTGNTPKQRPA